MQRNYRKELMVVLAFVLLNAVLLLTANLLPFIDLPNHLSEATINKYYNQPGNILSRGYAPIPWFHPNTFHTLFCNLFPSVETGNKIFFVLYVFLLPVSIFLIIRHLKGNMWYGLLAILVTYNYNVTFGFVGYTISIPTLFLLFYLTLLDIEYDRNVLKLCIMVMFILLFMMHAQTTLFAMVLFGLMTLWKEWKNWKRLFLRVILIPLPVLVIFFTWWMTKTSTREASTIDYLLRYYQHDFLKEFSLRARIIVFDNFQLQEGKTGLIIAASLFALIIIPLLFRRFRKRNPADPPFWKQYPYVLILLVLTLGCYLVLPDNIPGQAYIYRRLSCLVIISLIITGSLLLKNVRMKWLPAYSVTVVIIYAALWFEYLYTFNAINKGFNSSFFDGLSNKGRMAGLIYDNKYRGRYVYIHFPNYFIVRKRGLATSSIIDYRFAGIKRVASYSAIPYYDEYIGEIYNPHPEYKVLEYLLVRGKASVAVDNNFRGFTLFRQRGAWRLYKNDRLMK